MKQVELSIRNQTGLHARPAKVLVALAKQFKADLGLRCGAKRVNAKSMVSVLTLGATCGTSIIVEAAGEDEDEALARLEEAIRGGLGDLIPEPAQPEPAAGGLRGIGAAPGIAIGSAFQYQSPEPDAAALEAAACGGAAELEACIVQAREELRSLGERLVQRGLGAEAAIFEAQAELLEDPDLLAEVAARAEAGQGHARAWQAAVEERAQAIAGVADPLLAARAADLRDAGRRVLARMAGTQAVSLPDTPVIVLAKDLTPSETAAFDPERVLGFCIESGGPTAHIAILARAMGLPASVGAGARVLDVAPGTPVILNGHDGTLTPDPSPEALSAACEVQRRWLDQRRAAREQTAEPAVTTDGHRVEVSGNAGSVADARGAAAASADGIGLLRTEFLFLDRREAPGEEEQAAVYAAVAEAMGSHPVIVRTLDIGGDKPVPYIDAGAEANPFLGVRGLRLCLQQPALFATQLRAILRAARGGNLRIMFPMVSDLDEVRRAKALVETLRRELEAPPVPVGIMVEVPSAALLADSLAPEVDFFSIGTNDLTQYTLAMDRGNAALAARQDGLHPAVLRLIARTAEAAHRFGRMVGVCGELGSDPAAVPILVGLGVDELSVSVPLIPAVKAQVRSLSLGSAKTHAALALGCATAQEVRALARTFAP
jgi:phosphocarrier protein FPr